MSSREDWLEMQQANRALKLEHLEEQKKLKRMVSGAMQELKLADPRWKLYAEHIMVELERYKGKQRLVAQDLTNYRIFRSSESYGQLSLENAGTARYIEALEWCLNLIDKLINSDKLEDNNEQRFA